jgi:hypothetical protein
MRIADCGLRISETDVCDTQLEFRNQQFRNPESAIRNPPSAISCEIPSPIAVDLKLAADERLRHGLV